MKKNNLNRVSMSPARIRKMRKSLIDELLECVARDGVLDGPIKHGCYTVSGSALPEADMSAVMREAKVLRASLIEWARSEKKR